MRERACRFRPTLILLRSDAFHAVPAAPPLWRPMMPFTVDDKFHSHAKIKAISLAARGLWVSAGSWSSDHRRGGVVPDHVLADLGSTPELEGELLRVGLWHRIKRGIRFHEWERWNDTAEKAAQREAEAERKKREATERQRKKRALDRLMQEAAVTRDNEPDGAPPQLDAVPAVAASRGRHTAVTRKSGQGKAKRQVKAGAVTRDNRVTARVTPAAAHDLDLDPDQSLAPGSQSKSKSRTREELEPGTPGFRVQVQAEMAERGYCDVTDAEADAITAEVLGCAKDPVPHPLGYVLKAVKGEKNPHGRWLSAREPAPAATLAEFRPATRPHEFSLNGETGACAACKRDKVDKIHPRQKATA